jgi:DNA-binding Xre family transcriptional regulator
MNDSSSNLKQVLREIGQAGRNKRKAMKSQIHKNRTMSIEELAGILGTHKNTLHKFENGKAIMSDTLFRICTYLDIPFIRLSKEQLIEEIDYKLTRFYRSTLHSAEPEPIYHYQGRDKRITLREENGMKTLDLHDHSESGHQLKEGKMNAIVLEISGTTSTREHEGEELLFCLTGIIGVRIKNQEILLHKGDCLNFWGKDPHCYFNAAEGKVKSVALSVLCSNDMDINHINIHSEGL